MFPELLQVSGQEEGLEAEPACVALPRKAALPFFVRAFFLLSGARMESGQGLMGAPHASSIQSSLQENQVYSLLVNTF